MALPSIVAESAETGTIASIFQSSPDDQRVIIAHGYGIRVGIWNGQLEISDGIGKHRRTRKLPKADRTIKRLVITATEGYVTLAALRWCRTHDLSVHVIDAAGDLVATHVPESALSVKLLRRQCMAGPDGPLADKGLEVSRYLLTVKLRGQSRNAFQLLDNPQAAMKIDHYADMLTDATTYDEMNFLESQAANVYFKAWQMANVHIPWTVKDAEIVPDNWCTFDKRKSVITEASARNAIDPINACLNYGYGIGYAESRIACIGNHLHPQLGFMHVDNNDRDSLAADIIEAIRPTIDAYILGMLGYGNADPYPFTYKMFRQPDDLLPGTIRLVAPLTHAIAGETMQWQDQLSEIAHQVASILGAPVGKAGKLSNTLQRQKTEFQNLPVDIDVILPADVYSSAFASMLPPPNPSGTKRGTPVDNRRVIAAMIHLERHRKPWAHCPPAFNVSHRTLKNRRLDWQRAGCWDHIWSAIQDQAVKTA